MSCVWAHEIHGCWWIRHDPTMFTLCFHSLEWNQRQIHQNSSFLNCATAPQYVFSGNFRKAISAMEICISFHLCRMFDEFDFDQDERALERDQSWQRRLEEHDWRRERDLSTIRRSTKINKDSKRMPLSPLLLLVNLRQSYDMTIFVAIEIVVACHRQYDH